MQAASSKLNRFLSIRFGMSSTDDNLQNDCRYINGAGGSENNQGGAKQAEVRGSNCGNNLVFNSKGEIISSVVLCSFIQALREQCDMQISYFFLTFNCLFVA